MKGSKTTKQNGKEVILTFTVAECGEFHSLGEYHEGIGTLDEAAAVYQKIPHERMNGIPSIGINLHVEGTEKREDMQADVLTGGMIDVGIISYSPEFSDNPQVQAAVKAIIEKFPDKEIIDY